MPDVNTGLVDFALHPPLGLMKPHLDGGGPYTGNLTRTTWSSTLGPIFTAQPVSNTFGAILEVVAIPAAFGRVLGWTNPTTGGGEDIYAERFLQLVVQHQLLSGAWVTTQEFHMHRQVEVVMWDVALPGRLGFYTAPGIEIDVYFLLVN